MSVPVGGDPARANDADNHVRLAWRRDLYDMRCQTEDRLQVAVLESLQAYEELRRAQQDNAPARIADAHMRFETATRLTRARSDDRDQIDALIDADFAGRSATDTTDAMDATEAAAPSTAGPGRVRRLAAVLRKRS
jgi:hypothetical protein